MTKKKILVSACLVGQKCRYDGGHCSRDKIFELAKDHELIAICPEEMGGLSTPRDPAEIQNDGRVISNRGKDVTTEYKKGAELAAKVAKDHHVKEAYLKSRSPMCGCGEIYDGSFSGKKKGGDGILARLLKSMNIKIQSVD